MADYQAVMSACATSANKVRFLGNKVRLFGNKVRFFGSGWLSGSYGHL